MVRGLSIVLTLSYVSGCASAPCIPEKPRIRSRLDGVPETLASDRAELIQPEPRRYCQVLFEPAFATDHAVWLLVHPGGGARVAVSVATEGAPEILEAELDRSTATLLERECRSFLTSAPPTCERVGVDGVWYHAAHYVGESGYAMRSFWSPKPGTRDEKFVRLTEAIRDYAIAPERLRSVYFWNIHRAAAELE